MILMMIAQTPPDPSSPWLVLGVPGLMVVGFLTGQIVTKIQYKRESDRADAYEAKYDSLLRETQDKVLPVVTQFTHTVTVLVPVLERMVRTMEDERTAIPKRRLSGRPES